MLFSCKKLLTILLGHEGYTRFDSLIAYKKKQQENTDKFITSSHFILSSYTTILTLPILAVCRTRVKYEPQYMALLSMSSPQLSRQRPAWCLGGHRFEFCLLLMIISFSPESTSHKHKFFSFLVTSIDLTHDTRLLCTRFRIDRVKEMSHGISGANK